MIRSRPKRSVAMPRSWMKIHIEEDAMTQSSRTASRAWYGIAMTLSIALVSSACDTAALPSRAASTRRNGVAGAFGDSAPSTTPAPSPPRRPSAMDTAQRKVEPCPEAATAQIDPKPGPEATIPQTDDAQPDGSVLDRLPPVAGDRRRVGLDRERVPRHRHPYRCDDGNVTTDQGGSRLGPATGR